jgi:CO/xanthine dehydrogenase FAD-binding subunit
MRQQATIAGTLVTAAGRSTFGTAMMALDATLHWMPGMQDQSVGEWFTLRESPSIAKLIVRIQIPLNVSLAFDSIGRSPADLPILCAAVAKWPSGRTRIALGGFGKSPILALDAPDSGGFDAAVLNALAHSDDQWASSAYRREAGLPLVKRLINRDNTALDMDSPEGLQ